MLDDGHSQVPDAAAKTSRRRGRTARPSHIAHALEPRSGQLPRSRHSACDIPTSALQDAEALVLDWDGTLADTHQARCRALSEALAPYDVHLVEDWYRARAGLPILDLLALLPTPVPTDRVRAASARLLLQHLESGHLQPIPATMELLSQARAADLPCAIASSASRRLVYAGLHALNLRKMFAAVVTADDVACGKPAPDPFLQAAAQLAKPAAACLAVDDTSDGITSARAAGMRVLTLAGDPPTLVPPTAGA